MESKKPINKIDVDELIKIAQTESKEKQAYHHLNDISSFVHFIKINPGSNAVSFKTLYNLYRDWSNNPVKKYTFNNQLKTSYSYKQIGIHKYYFFDKTELDLREILNAEKQRKVKDYTKTKSKKNHFDSFLNFYNIKPGDYYIEDFVLYNLYDKWTYKNKNKSPFSMKNFRGFCNLYFLKKENKVKAFYWYGVEKSVLNNFQEGEIQQIIEAHEKEE